MSQHHQNQTQFRRVDANVVFAAEATDACRDAPQLVPKLKRMAFDPSEVDFSSPFEPNGPAATHGEFTTAERAALETTENRPSSVNLDQMFNLPPHYFHPQKREPTELPISSGQPLYAQQQVYGGFGGYAGYGGGFNYFNPQPTYLPAYASPVSYSYPYCTQVSPTSAAEHHYHDVHKAPGDIKPVLNAPGQVLQFQRSDSGGGRAVKSEEPMETGHNPTPLKHSPTSEGGDEDVCDFNSFFVESVFTHPQQHSQGGEMAAEQKPLLTHQGALTHLPVSAAVGAIPLYGCAGEGGTPPVMSAVGEVSQPSVGYWAGTPTIPTPHYPMVLLPAPAARTSRKRPSGAQLKGVVKKPTNAAKAVMHVNSRCSNCRTTETTLWRRSPTGEIECNSCNLYFRKNQKPRPLHMCGRSIMRRRRHNKAQLLEADAGMGMKTGQEKGPKELQPQRESPSAEQATLTNDDDALNTNWTSSSLGDYYGYR